MGCSAPGGFRMALFGRRAEDEAHRANRARLERKLCVARESPEPTFDLAGCGLSKVPKGVYSLCLVFRKETLDLDDNRLTSLRDGGDLGDLRLLRTLTLVSNRLERLPSDIGRLSGLGELRLDRNRLEALPDAIGELVGLRILTVADNRLRRLPAALGSLRRLRRLSATGNPELKALPKELAGVRGLTTIELDADNYAYPPAETARGGAAAILEFLCREAGVEYSPPEEVDGGDSPETRRPVDYSKNPLTPPADWEREERHLQLLESQFHERSKKQREQFLKDCASEREKLDRQFDTIQQKKDLDRADLIKQVIENERSAEAVVKHLLQMNTSSPLRIQRFLEHDQREHDRLLEMCRANYINLKKTDTLKAMESLLQEECEHKNSLKVYGESQSEAKQSFLLEELNANCQLETLLKTRDELQSDLIAKLLTDENVQKAAVAALLERCDARTWGLTQEISLVEYQLANLSKIELERKKLELNENVDNICSQRLQLSILLVDLLEQQEARRSQLVETLQAMELEKTNSDFWLIRYQQLMETTPDEIISAQKRLDPLFTNHLLQQGVIHCLPFLINKVFDKDEFASLGDEILQQLGIRLSSDRNGIIKAVELYLEEIRATETKIPNSPSSSPSAPPESPDKAAAPSAPVLDVDMEKPTSECVVCMETFCEIVFIPCGHLCCCSKCSNDVGQSCPMCRGNIERKIRVIQP